jgi:hypothetical protein
MRMATTLPLKPPLKEFGPSTLPKDMPSQSEFLNNSRPILMFNRSNDGSSASSSPSSSSRSLSTSTKIFGPQDHSSAGTVQKHFLSRVMKQKRLFRRDRREIDDDQSKDSQSTSRRIGRFMRWRRNGSSSSFSEDCFEDAEADVNFSILG